MQEIFTKNDLHFAKKRVSFGFICRNRPKRLPEKARSDMQKVADGKFLYVGDRRKDAAGGGGRFNWIVWICCFCKLQRIFIADRVCHKMDRHIRILQKSTRMGHPRCNQIVLGRHVLVFRENVAQIRSVQVQLVRKHLHMEIGAVIVVFAQPLCRKSRKRSLEAHYRHQSEKALKRRDVRRRRHLEQAWQRIVYICF